MATRPLGDGARLLRGRSTLADAQRRYNAAADQDDRLEQMSAPTPDPSPPRAARAGGGERAVLGEAHEPTGEERRRAAGWQGRPPGEVELSLLTHQARALYEGGVVPVRVLARLCGVSLRTLYHHVAKQSWRRRRSAVPRDAKKSARQKARTRERRALEPPRPRGLKARDPVGQAAALALAERAGALAGAALAAAVARQDAEAKARILAIMARAVRDVAIANETVTKKRTRGEDKVKRRRPYRWRPMTTWG